MDTRTKITKYLSEPPKPNTSRDLYSTLLGLSDSEFSEVVDEAPLSVLQKHLADSSLRTLAQKHSNQKLLDQLRVQPAVPTESKTSLSPVKSSQNIPSTNSNLSSKQIPSTNSNLSSKQIPTSFGSIQENKTSSPSDRPLFGGQGFGTPGSSSRTQTSSNLGTPIKSQGAITNRIRWIR